MTKNYNLKKFLQGAILGTIVIVCIEGYYFSKYLFPTKFEISNVSIESLDGKKIDLKSESKPIILNFMSQGCVPCIQELPVFEAKTEKYKDSIMIYVVLDDKIEDIKEFQKERPFKVNYVHSVKSYSEYGILGVPQTYFVKNGVITDSSLGGMDSEKMEKRIQNLLR